MIKKAIHILLLSMIAVPTIALALIIVFSFFGQLALWAELLSHFVCFYIVASIILLLLAAAFRFKIIALLAAVCLLVNLARIVPQCLAVVDRKPPAGSQEIRLLHLNCWGPKNSKPAEILEIARERKADIVCFCEIENGWFKRINNTFTDYPYKALFPHFGGLGFVSKFPIVSWTVKEAKFWHRPRLYAEVKLKDGRILNLLVAHPTIPVHKDVFDCRNQDFSFFAEEFGARENPRILVGDLNCSPWSYYFQKLLGETGLNDSEVGFGPQPTWSPGGKLVPLLPIDHFLVSKDFVVADHHIERFAGADHRPVFVDLWLKPKANDSQAMPGGVR